MVEMVDHLQLLPPCAHIQIRLLRRYTEALANGDYIWVMGQNFLVHLLQKLVNAWPVGVNRQIAKSPFGIIGESGVFRQKRNHIHPKPIHALVEPKPHHPINFLPKSGVLPVQIGLFFGKQVQIIVACYLVECPGRAGEKGLPVVGKPPPPDIIIPIRVVFAFAALPKPAMFVGRVINHQIQNQAHSPLVNA